MRIGLTLLVALTATAFCSAAWAESDTVVVETVDAGNAMQSFAPDLSGLDQTDDSALPVDDASGEVQATDADVEAGDEAADDGWGDGDAGLAPEAGQAMEQEPADDAAWDDGDAVAGDEVDAWSDAEGDAAEPMQAEPMQGDATERAEAPAERAPQTYEGTSIVVNGETLGPVGVDAEGHVGRIHTVKKGDTLWDISHAYLGTAWVWPSVWKENDEIANPHLIEPGQKLWISSTEIRPISDQEAEEYVAAVEPEPEAETVAADIDDDFSDFAEVEAAADADEFLDMASMDEFAGEEMDQLPVGMPEAEAEGNETGRTVRVSMRENMSFVSDAQLQASTEILGSPSDRQFLAQLDTIYLGLGEGEVEVGDQFTIFRNITDVRSPKTHQLLGYHVDVLGWAEVTEVTGDTCVATIRVSVDGAVKGDRVIPRYQTPTDIKVKYPQGDIDGEIAFLPASRTLMGTTDYVFVDVGAVHGVEIGTDLEVYDAGSFRHDDTRDLDLRTPDRVIADLVVVTVQEESAVAFVAHTRRELAVGDTVRGATRDFPSAF